MNLLILSVMECIIFRNNLSIIIVNVHLKLFLFFIGTLVNSILIILPISEEINFSSCTAL